MIQQAVILAAGLGQRLQNRWSDQPKGLLPFDGQSLVARSVANLKAAGIAKIVLVTGHLAVHYETLAAQWPGVRCIHNSDYAHTGSFRSLCVAGRSLSESTLVLESDLLYEPAALTALLDDPWPDLVLVGRSPLHDKVYVQADTHRRLTGLGKSADLADGACGELVGICKVSQALLYHLLSLDAPSSQRWDYEQALVRAAGQFDLRVSLRPDLAWCEIDDATHYDVARKTIWPVIQQRGNDVAPT